MFSRSITDMLALESLHCLQLKIEEKPGDSPAIFLGFMWVAVYNKPQSG